MDQNIHSRTHVMDEKWTFLLIMNIDNSDKLCQHLVETEKMIPPPLNPPSQWQTCKAMEILGRATMCAQKDKGMQTQA